MKMCLRFAVGLMFLALPVILGATPSNHEFNVRFAGPWAFIPHDSTITAVAPASAFDHAPVFGSGHGGMLTPNVHYCLVIGKSDCTMSISPGFVTGPPVQPNYVPVSIPKTSFGGVLSGCERSMVPSCYIVDIPSGAIEISDSSSPMRVSYDPKNAFPIKADTKRYTMAVVFRYTLSGVDLPIQVCLQANMTCSISDDSDGAVSIETHEPEDLSPYGEGSVAYNGTTYGPYYCDRHPKEMFKDLQVLLKVTSPVIVQMEDNQQQCWDDKCDPQMPGYNPLCGGGMPTGIRTVPELKAALNELTAPANALFKVDPALPAVLDMRSLLNNAPGPELDPGARDAFWKDAWSLFSNYRKNRKNARWSDLITIFSATSGKNCRAPLIWVTLTP